MRVLPFNLGPLASASLVLANACKPRTAGASSVGAVTSSSTSIVIQSSSAMSSIGSSSGLAAGPSSSSSSSALPSSSPVPLSTFYIAAGNSDSLGLDEELLKLVGDGYPVLFDSPTARAIPCYLETGTGYLMIGGLYVAYFLADGALFSVDPNLLSETALQVVCSPAFEGVAMSCAVAGRPSITAPFVYDGYQKNSVCMGDPSDIPPAAHTLDFISQALCP